MKVAKLWMNGHGVLFFILKPYAILCYNNITAIILTPGLLTKKHGGIIKLSRNYLDTYRVDYGLFM